MAFTWEQKYVDLQEEHYRVSEQCREQELTLEELGSQLSHSKLEVSELREEASASRGVNDALWASDKAVTHCKTCTKEFNLTRRKASSVNSWAGVIVPESFLNIVFY